MSVIQQPRFVLAYLCVPLCDLCAFVVKSSMRPGDVIQTKRDGGELSRAQIDAFVTAAARPDGSGWEKYHLTALLMAIYLKGMTDAETAYLTRAMADSGT